VPINFSLMLAIARCYLRQRGAVSKVVAGACFVMFLRFVSG
jgi:hypothetical protein